MNNQKNDLMSLTNKSFASAKGVHTMSVCDMRSKEAQDIEKMMEMVRLQREFLIKRGLATKKTLRDLWKEYSYYRNILNNKFLVKQLVIENVTTTVGRSVLAQRLGGDTTYTGTITHTALGTDNTSPDVGDTTLGSESYRKALSSGTDNNNVAYIETFFTASEVSGTFEEYGNFIDGSAGADTGQLFNRFTASITKSLTESLNVQSQITFNDA